MCTSVVISWKAKKKKKKTHPEDAGFHTKLPVATRRLPDVYGDYTDTP